MIMEGYLYKWINMINGWKPRYIQISIGTIEFSNSKNSNANKKIINITQIEILEVNMKKFEIIIIDKEKNNQISLRASSEFELASWIVAIKESQSKVKMKIMEEIQKNSPKIEAKEMKIEDPIKGIYDCLINIKDTNNEMNSALTIINEQLQSKKDKSHPLFKAYDTLFKIKHVIKQSTASAIYCYDQLKKFENETTSKKIKEKDEIFYDLESNLDDNQKEDDYMDEDSFEDCNLNVNFDRISIDKLERSMSQNKISNLSILENSYDYIRRNKLDVNIKSSNSMISDMVKAAMKEKGSLPITYNEPLSMLQRCIEPFQNFDLLDKAYNEINLEDTFCYLSAFVISEYCFNINRLLKPFNPILGETYEYIDKENGFIAFSEQVSHHPPISAYLVESSKITVFGDSKNKHKFLLIKGSLEITFSSKINILFHNENVKIDERANTANHHFQYNRPFMYIKGLIYRNPHYDCSGIVKIEDLKNSEVYSELNFFEDGKKGKPFGYVEGKVYKNTKVKYIIKGNWTDSVDLYDLDNNKLKSLWKVRNDEFLTNTDTYNNYLLSKYAYDLNYIDDKLAKCLPVTDSRLRPDQRKLEEGKIEEAEELKVKLEEAQRIRAKIYEKEKKIYKPIYFDQVNDNSGTFYVPKRNYWEDRINLKYDHLENIFNIDH